MVIKSFQDQQKRCTAYRLARDYYVFFPLGEGKFRTRNLPADGPRPDLVYIADTYGVYRDDYASIPRGNRSAMIYGGLNPYDLHTIATYLDQGSTLIAEFNSLASPTGGESRRQLEDLAGIRWEGWMGRYFNDLARGKEVPPCMVITYAEQYQQPWKFSGPGFALVSEDDRIVVLLVPEDIGSKTCRFKLVSPYDREFGIKRSIPYYYWFELTRPREGTEVLATYHLDTTKKGQAKLKQAGLPSDFPAILRQKTPSYTSYYFAGDFADSELIPRWHQIKGLPTWKRYLTIDIRGNPHAFYWRAYVPLMQKIIDDVLTGKQPASSGTNTRG